MPKPIQTAVQDSGFESEPIPDELQVASILLTRRMHWNGHTLPEGATIGGIPIVQARQMVEDHGVQILRIDRSAEAQRLQRKNGIEHKLPAGLSSDYEAANPVPGQSSSVFINMAELRELQNR
jgi:hypothetical protein